MSDAVDRPSHYTQGKIEVLDFIVDQRLDHCLGCVVKYVCRHKLKGGLEDLKKARRYLDTAIENYEWLTKEPGTTVK